MPVDVQSDRVVITHGESVAEVLLWGATVTSWKYKGIERLFVSSKAVLDGTKAVRGGIPLVFPQFGPGPLPQHGFARVSKWTWGGLSVENASETRVEFSLLPEAIPASQKAIWPHDFRLVYTVALFGSSLQTTLRVRNLGTAPFEFTSLLHTYLRIKDIDHAGVVGLTGYPFADKVTETRTESEPRLSVRVASEVDRIYQRVKNDHITVEGTGVGGGAIVIHKSGFDDVVVWNPWVDKAKGMSDFGDEEFKEMICVEVGNVSTPRKLGPNETWEAGQRGGRRRPPVLVGEGQNPKFAFEFLAHVDMKKTTTKFPAARIKKIMRLDEDVGKVAQVTPLLISKALECFLQSMLEATLVETRARNAKRMTVAHV
ncbi:hypothetical protein HK105_207613 [Polyrhizophydium stewartii]|uniref:glucose-6-phosphate 1-epimerase n=1 Tax=Polyrhizophydium stewartii TaxID=2732419 RepID=A0ABR4N093_9FUNG